MALVFLLARPLEGREKDAIQYGAGLIVNIPYGEAEVTQVVQDVAQNGIIRGTKEYNKDEYVSGAEIAESTRVFRPWSEGGKVFYKVRAHALDPRNFKDSGDVGMLAVRYVVQAQGDKNTVLRIDAVFVEDFRHTAHASNGSVEGAEYKDIHDRLDQLKLMKDTPETDRARREESSSRPVQLETPAPAAIAETTSVVIQPGSNSLAHAETSHGVETPEQRVRRLKQEVERRVKAPGAPLKSAPFHSASTLTSLPTGTDVLIVISTPYWVGIETHDGQNGWVFRDDLEQVP